MIIEISGVVELNFLEPYVYDEQLYLKHVFSSHKARSRKRKDFQRKVVIISFLININICYWCSKEQSQ